MQHGGNPSYDCFIYLAETALKRDKSENQEQLWKQKSRIIQNREVYLLMENMDHEMGHILNGTRQNERVSKGASPGNRKKKNN